MEQMIILILLGILTVVLAQQQELKSFTFKFDPPQCCFGKPKEDDFKKIGKNYYKVMHTNLKWSDALAHCALIGSQLASIDTLEELNAISAYLKGAGIHKWLWVAATDQLSVGTFRWIATGEHIAKNLWAPGQPDLPLWEHCVHLRPMGPNCNYRLNNWECHRALFYLCQKKAPKSVAVLMWP